MFDESKLERAWRVWVRHGGHVAFCPEATVFAEMVGHAYGRATTLQLCARAIVDAGFAQPARIAIVARGTRAETALAAVTAEPTAFGAVVLEDPLDSAQTLAKMRLDDARLPPVLVWVRRDSSLRVGADLVARLSVSHPRDLAALLLRDDSLSTSSPQATEAAAFESLADVQAFLRWALEGDGRDRMPRFQRQP